MPLLPVHWYVDVVVGLQATKLDHEGKALCEESRTRQAVPVSLITTERLLQPWAA